ncbi:hypothetical protein AB0I16_22920 [Streptomyces sp. NPDC050703]|uniref:hypothetical protein n=1 Tax=Streptomyces sp. NPDC050703 TaxID=3157218 RepID=UPI00342F44D6
MARVVTDDEQAAQRRVGGIVRTSSVLTGGGLAMWRDHPAVDRETSAAELSRDLDTLKVPHRIVVAFRPPRGREAGRRKGQEVRVPFPELASLVRWVPLLQQLLDELPADSPGFTFAYCQTRPTGPVMMNLSSLAAEWPAWTVRQAELMGLLCARCGFDLRTRGATQRLAYDADGAPLRPRLVCGVCCGDGQAALDGLTALGEAT